MNRFRASFSCLALSLCLASPIAAQTLINTNKVVDTIACTGQDILVNGNKAELTLTGACGLVKVNGNKNHITVEAAESIHVPGNKNHITVEAAKDIHVLGNKNRITWSRGVEGDRPSIRVPGQKNIVKRAAGAGSGSGGESVQGGAPAVAPSSEPAADTSTTTAVMVFNENSLQTSYQCSGNDVSVNGNQNVLNFEGVCGAVAVNGNRNTVTLNSAASILTAGNDNQVTWVSGVGETPPALVNPGNGNKVSKAGE